jgi:zinc finger CCHC domain-containing protein 9
MSSKNGTLQAQAPPGMGKWNRSKRRVQQQSMGTTKKKVITKVERREKYTAIAKERQIRNNQKELICFQCRRKGHSIQYCTTTIESSKNDVDNITELQPIDSKNNNKRKRDSASTVNVCCYKCGSTEHNLANCPQNQMHGTKHSKEENTLLLPYATCFVCHQKGHLASQCSMNDHGIYINGGQCNYCLSKYHRGSNCPNKKRQSSKDRSDERSNNQKDGNGNIQEYDFSELLQEESNEKSNNGKFRKKIQADKTPSDKKRVVHF